MCESNLNDAVYDKVTISSITGAILSADLGGFPGTPKSALKWLQLYYSASDFLS